jgi:ADP-heptose:LPS heptosyltransferase
MKKILIYRHCSLGDFIVSLPAIRLIRKLNPGSKIYLASLKKNDKRFVTPNLIPLENLYINDFIFFNYSFFSIYRFFKNIRKHNFDEVYYLNEVSSKIRLKRDEIIFSLLNIKKKIGFDLIKYDYNSFNETYYLCKRVKKEIKNNSILFSKIFKKKKKQYSYITLSMGGKNDSRKWNHENWKKLIKMIRLKFPKIKVYIVGTLHDFKKANEISKLNKKKIINLCGKTNIKQLFNKIKCSSYHISHDDGTMHIASCFEKNGVSIFGLTDIKGKWFPTNNNLKIFYPKKHINEIKAENVFKRINFDLQKLFKKKKY